jgi:hypothetical protein
MKVIDKNGPEWLNIKAQVSRQIEELRQDMEAPCLPQAETEHLRGKIAGLRWVLGDGEGEMPAVNSVNEYSLLK